MGLQRALPTLEDEWVKTLPLVFHIVHTGGEENITDAQVLSSVQAANEHFREGDVDTKIDWCLAQRDPQDNPTSGHNAVQRERMARVCSRRGGLFVYV